MRKGAWLSHVADVVTIVFVLVALVFLFSPSGPGGRWWKKVKSHRDLRASTLAHWDALSFSGSGSSDPDVVVFIDYECPFCATIHSSLERLLDWRPELEVVYRDFPLANLHPSARPAAIATECAREQDRFLEMQSQLFASKRWSQDGDWTREATAAGVMDLEQFSRCLLGIHASTVVESDIQLGRLVGIRSTPTLLFPSGAVLTGGATVAELARTLGGDVE